MRQRRCSIPDGRGERGGRGRPAADGPPTRAPGGGWCATHAAAGPGHGSIRWAAGTTIGYAPQKVDIERDLPLTGGDLLRAKAVTTGVAGTEVDRGRSPPASSAASRSCGRW